MKASGPEHAQKAEDELPGMVFPSPYGLANRAVVGKLAEGDIPAVTVSCIGCPPAEDALSAVGLSDVLLAVS